MQRARLQTVAGRGGAQSAAPAKHIAGRMGATRHNPSQPLSPTPQRCAPTPTPTASACKRACAAAPLSPRPFDRLRTGIEQLCRYITRPAIANERLSVNRESNVMLKLKPALSLLKGPRGATARLTWCSRRWNSCGGWRHWCPGRGCTGYGFMACWRRMRSGDHR